MLLLWLRRYETRWRVEANPDLLEGPDRKGFDLDRVGGGPDHHGRFRAQVVLPLLGEDDFLVNPNRELGRGHTPSEYVPGIRLQRLDR